MAWLPRPTINRRPQKITLTLSREDFASVMAAIDDYVTIVDSPFMDSSAIDQEDLTRLKKIAGRMLRKLEKSRNGKDKVE